MRSDCSIRILIQRLIWSSNVIPGSIVEGILVGPLTAPGQENQGEASVLALTARYVSNLQKYADETDVIIAAAFFRHLL